MMESAARTAKKVVEKLRDAAQDVFSRLAAKKPAVSVVGNPRSAEPSGADFKVAKNSSISASDQTMAGALAHGITSDDVRRTMHNLSSSEDVAAESEDFVDSATDVREHYFDAQPAAPPPPQPPRDVPDEYGDTKIMLMVRDPEWVHAYWEINDETRSHLGLPRDKAPGKRLVIRVYKVTDTTWPVDQAHYFFDVEVPYEARSWYVNLPEANQQWCAELGVLDNEENYTAICRSNAVVTPRNTISDRIDSDWMTVEESFEKITRLSRAEMEDHLRGAGSPGSEAILRTINRQLTAVLHGEKIALSSGIFSSESGLPDRSRNFWLQVHTELILYGATEPDAKVTVQGRNVELNPDGTFSMRFALPDGVQVLDVRAVNKAGDLEENITPVVERTTQ